MGALPNQVLHTQRRVFSDDVSLNQNDDKTAANGLLNGEQQSGVGIVSLQAGYRF